MSLGKAAAQVGHGSMLLAAHQPFDWVQSWARRGFELCVVETDPDVFKYYRGETPAGDMQVIPVDNVDEAVDALTKIKNGAAPDQFPTCG